jgi:GTP-binding protein
MPQYFVTSATEATGRDVVLEYIDAVNQDVFKDMNGF